MITTAELVAKYAKGMITADHLAIDCVTMIDPESPGLVLNNVPEPILSRIIGFAEKSRSGPMLSNYGTVPTFGQFAAVRRWVEETRPANVESDVSTTR